MKIFNLLNTSLFESIDAAFSFERGEFDELDLGFFPSNVQEHGDYSSSAPLKLSKRLKSSPREIAKEIVKRFESKLIKSISIDGPGFINIYVTDDAKVGEVKNAASDVKNKTALQPPKLR